jgi:hypothetical protein
MSIYGSQDSSNFADIRSSIEHSKTNNLLLVNLSKRYEINGLIIQSPISIFGRYWSYIRSELVNYTMLESDMYRPENVSKRLYDTRDLAFMLKVINGIYSSKDFNKKTIKVIHPLRIGKISDIIAANASSIARYKASPEKLEDLTIKPVL